MAYVVSARKYRPKTFDEVVGQRAVTNVLKKAIEKQRLAQALLFTGPRGVGKTSCARIMAREVNRPYLEDPDADLSFNIFELDAASNNSVDDIRELIEQVRIPPQIGKYKVYIIDEVHMLSNQAFNAFLKTLEEPPEHAIFILATTEKHKIIPTILSRCQIYDFKRISVKDIKEHLKSIASREGIQMEEDAFYLIAQKADGSLRDALSAFDKIISAVGQDQEITREIVAEHLGILDYEAYFGFTDLVISGDAAGLMIQFNTWVDNGMDIHHFIGGLASHFRQLLLAKNSSTLEIVEVSEAIKEKYKKQAEALPNSFILKAIDILTHADLNYKMSQHPQLLTELSLLQILENFTETKKKTTDGKHALIRSSAVEEKKTYSPTPAETKATDHQPNIQENNLEEKTRKNPPENPVVSAPPKGSGLKSIKKLVEKSQNNGSSYQNLREKFTPAEFMKYWNEYLDMLYRGNDKNKFILMSKADPKVEGETITLHFESEQEVASFQPVAENLLKFLKKHLRNGHISFTTRIVEPKTVETPQVSYYTRQEKQSRLIEINEDVAYFIKKFKLQ